MREDSLPSQTFVGTLCGRVQLQDEYYYYVNNNNEEYLEGGLTI